MWDPATQGKLQVSLPSLRPANPTDRYVHYCVRSTELATAQQGYVPVPTLQAGSWMTKWTSSSTTNQPDQTDTTTQLPLYVSCNSFQVIILFLTRLQGQPVVAVVVVVSFFLFCLLHSIPGLDDLALVGCGLDVYVSKSTKAPLCAQRPPSSPLPPPFPSCGHTSTSPHLPPPSRPLRLATGLHCFDPIPPSPTLGYLRSLPFCRPSGLATQQLTDRTNQPILLPSAALLIRTK